jgi:hypothetical protein
MDRKRFAAFVVSDRKGGEAANLLFAIDYLLFMEVRRWRARLRLKATRLRLGLRRDERRGKLVLVEGGRGGYFLDAD